MLSLRENKNTTQAKDNHAMHRPLPGPLWPPTDDPVENSLRRAYLRTPPPRRADDSLPDTLQDLLGTLTEVLRRAELRKSA